MNLKARDEDISVNMLDAPRKIGHNELAVRYGISARLFEMRGMSEHYIESYALGQKTMAILTNKRLKPWMQP